MIISKLSYFACYWFTTTTTTKLWKGTERCHSVLILSEIFFHPLFESSKEIIITGAKSGEHSRWGPSNYGRTRAESPEKPKMLINLIIHCTKTQYNFTIFAIFFDIADSSALLKGVLRSGRISINQHLAFGYAGKDLLYHLSNLILASVVLFPIRKQCHIKTRNLLFILSQHVTSFVHLLFTFFSTVVGNLRVENFAK